MSQTTITAFFNSRKRAATDEIISSKSKIAHIDHASLSSLKHPLRTAFASKKCENDNCTSKETSEEDHAPLGKVCTSVTSQQTSCILDPPNAKSTALCKKINASNIISLEPSKLEASTSTKSARKELSLGDLKKKLANSSKLAELRASADRISKGIQQLKEASDKKNLKEFKSIDVEVPLSPHKRAVQNSLSSPKTKTVQAVSREKQLISPRKVVVSPVKSPSKVPAYIRHASLATTSTSLPLPHQYRFLGELFRGMETVVALIYNRNEKVTFAKLKPSVQEMLKRNFTEKHLAQIKNLVPDFYNYEIQKVRNFSASSHKESYELVISPNFPSDFKIMNPSVLLERRRYFYDILLQLTKKHHSQFLLTLDPPMVIADDKLTRWHPEFELEKVPDVEIAKLPEAPNTEKFSSAQDVLSKARELFKCNTKMERALEKLAQAKTRGLTDEEKKVTGMCDNEQSKRPSIDTNQSTNTPSTSGITILNPALKNLPASLLEKVKAKQAAKALEAMTRSSEDDQKYIIYSRLPDLARTLRNIYVTERKNVLALNVILSKLDSSFKANVAAKDLQRDIKVLTREVPEWIKLHDVRNTTYLKLDRNADLKSIIFKLDALAQKYKNE